jgi:hypothetical protein
MNLRKHSTALLLDKNDNIGAKKFTRSDLEKAYRKKHKASMTPLKMESLIASTTKTSGGESQLKSLDASVKICARKYNECKASGDRIEGQLKTKKDELSELQREKCKLDQMIVGNNHEAKAIVNLKIEIRKANDDSDKKLHYRLKLNQMHAREMNLSTGMDATINDLSRCLSSAELEKNQCQTMLSELESSLASISYTYDTLVRDVEVERSNREQVLASKQLEATNAKKIEAWRSDQEVIRKGFEQEIQNSLQLERDSKLVRIKELEHELKALSKRSDNRNIGQGSCEDDFLRIKRSTGINSIQDLVEKFTHHIDENDRLLQEKAAAENRYDSIKSSLKMVSDEYDKLNSIGHEKGDFCRVPLRDLRSNIEKEKDKNKVIKSAAEEMDMIILRLRQGVTGLHKRLFPFQSIFLDDEDNVPSTTLSGTSSESISNVLKAVDEIISLLVHEIGGIDQATNTQLYSYSIAQRESISKLENPNLGDNNCRIQVRQSKKQTNAVEPNEDFDDIDNDIKSRKAVKLLSKTDDCI